jgi:hypothetical protein
MSDHHVPSQPENMRKRTIHLFVWCALLCQCVPYATGQQLSPRVTATQGDYRVSGGYSLSWTLGETFTTTLEGSHILTQGFQQPEIDLFTGEPEGIACAGSEIEVPFTAIGYFGPDNIFLLELSDAEGSFDSPVFLGAMQSGQSGVMPGQLPAGTPPGDGYRVRVTASIPLFRGVPGMPFTVESPVLWYADADGDGFGDPSAAVLLCEMPEGYTANGEDCDDTNALVNPLADEICNLIDDNCDGVTDEEGGIVWYADADGDGFGNASVSVTACEMPPGYVTAAGDCADEDPLRYPGAKEICNGLDDDCDGLVDEGAGNKPPVPAFISGPLVVCAGQQGLVFSCPPLPGVTFNWQVPQGATIVSGQGTNSIVVNWGTKKGNVSVQSESSCGRSPKRTISVNLGPCAPSGGDNPGMVLQQGDTEMVRLQAFPNPFSDELNIVFTLQQASEVTLEMIDLTGRQVALLYSGITEAGIPVRTLFESGGIAPGMLICRLHTPEGSFQKVVMLVK